MSFTPPAWEYQIESIDVSKYGRNDTISLLHELGRDGWELVSVAPLVAGGGQGSGTNVGLIRIDTGLVAFFKRPVR